MTASAQLHPEGVALMAPRYPSFVGPT